MPCTSTPLGYCKLKDLWPPLLTWASSAKKIVGWITDNRRSIPGKILILSDNRSFSRELYKAVESMPHPENRGWVVEAYPKVFSRRHLDGPHVVVSSQEKKKHSERELIFISHANPEDNDFALWLSMKLRAAGYRTWVDFEDLRGGEIFWDKIEQIIRNECGKFIFVQTETSLSKNNVLNELDLALSVERRRAMKDFVVPLRIDESPFDKTYMALRRRLVIDCAPDWKRGLLQLLRKLEDDNIPHNVSTDSVYRGQRESEHGETGLIISRLDKHLSNWYEFVAFPKSISWREGAEESDGIDSSFAVTDCNRVYFFSSTIDNGTKSNTETKSLTISRFLEGRDGDSKFIPRRDAYRVLTGLIRKAWERRMVQLGLKPYRMSRYKAAWFWPDGQLSERKVKFVDVFGEDHSRVLIGRSEKYRVYWHFAVEAQPEVSTIRRMVFRPHVVFTVDGRTPVDSNAVMHRLRRSFCKNWWNDRWRDLLGAFAKSIATNEVIELSTGGEPITMDVFPVVFVSPVSTNVVEASIEEGISEWQADDFDDESESALYMEGLVRE